MAASSWAVKSQAKVGPCKEAVLKINLLYERKEACDHSFPPVVQNVYLDNVTCDKSKYGVMIEGYEDICNIRNIEVKNCHFNGVQDGNSIKGMVKNVIIANTYINGKLRDEAQSGMLDARLQQASEVDLLYRHRA